MGYDGKGTLGWLTSGIVYDSSSGSGVALVAAGQQAAGKGRACVETGTLEEVGVFLYAFGYGLIMSHFYSCSET